MNTNGNWKNTFVSPYFTVSGTWVVIPFNFKPLIYEVKIPVNGQKNGVCQRLYMTNNGITIRYALDIGMYQCKF